MLTVDKQNYFGYETIGEFHSEGEWIHPTRIIDSYELIFVLEGVVYIAEDGVEYELHQNECIILEPGKTHGGYKPSKEPTAFYWLHFRTSFQMPFKTYAKDEFYDVKYLLKKLLHISKTPSYKASALDSAALMIFNELECAEAAGYGSSLANKIAEYVRINVAKNITAAMTAEHFGYNTDYISKLFKKIFGVGLKQYIIAERVKYAKDLLLTTGLSVKEISAHMGFDEENLFIKFFVYHEEISPSQFRNKYFNTHMNNK